ncbi:MAG: DNA-processing protein DprA [Solirubrobacterales bacterium]
MSPTACRPCLRRAGLLEALSPLIEVVAMRQAGSSAPELLAMSDDQLVRKLAPRGSPGMRRALARAAGPSVLEARQRNSGVWSVCRHRDEYPEPLRDLGAEAPAALFGRGHRDALADLAERRAVAIVGARRASGYGRTVGRDLARQLSVAGVRVISGLANGVDAAAHDGALAGSAQTIAVLGSGADRVYPRQQSGLYERVLASGAALSELPPGAPPRRWTFPARNRIIAALSAMTVVVAAADRSGSLITAEMAADLGREVGAVPGPVNAPSHAGANRLLVDGARVIRGGQDALDALFGPGERAVAEVGPDPGIGGRAVLAEIERGATPDAVAATLALPPAEVSAGLARLELDGYVVGDAGGRYERTSLDMPPPGSPE